jgi:hypothetical protein
VAFRLGASNREHLIVCPSWRAHPEAIDYWDGNWVHATIEIAAGGFRGKLEARLRAEELVGFRDQIRPLQEKLGRGARLETMEGWLSVDIKGDGKGHFHPEQVEALESRVQRKSPSHPRRRAERARSS